MDRGRAYAALVLLIMTILVIPPGTAGLFSSDVERGSYGGSYGSDGKMLLSFDRNGNGVDDSLDDSPAGDYRKVVISWSHIPTDEDIRALESLGVEPEFNGRHLPMSTVSRFPLSLTDRVISLPDVVAIEHQMRFVPCLDAATPALRAASSAFYRPYTAADLGFNGGGVGVAILDSGVDDRHSSLAGHYVGGHDFTIIGNPPITGNPNDNFGHGTKCAGCAVGNGGGGDNVGTAPNASLIDLKVYGVDTDPWSENLISAVDWMIENKDRLSIRVASISLGSSEDSNGDDAVCRAINTLVENGVVAVVAMGNDGAERIPSPAAADGVISVGATDEMDTIDRDDDERVSWSNFGPRNDDGDSDQIDELKPDVMAPGAGIKMPEFNTLNAYQSADGTSFSTPLVAGVAALMLQANPDLTPDMVKAILRDTAEPMGKATFPAKDDKYNRYTGWGQVDAFGAVKRALNVNSTSFQALIQGDWTEPVSVSASVDVTRSEFEERPLNVTFNMTLANVWDPQGSLTLSASGMTAETHVSDIARSGREWWLTGWISFGEKVLRPTDGSVALAIDVLANGTNNLDEDDFNIRLWINGIPVGTPSLEVKEAVEKPPDETVDLYVGTNDINLEVQDTNGNNYVDEEDYIVIYATAHLLGQFPVYEVEFALFNDFPFNPNVTALYKEDVDIVPGPDGTGSVTIDATTKLPEGNYNMWAWIDHSSDRGAVNGEINETDETNNIASAATVTNPLGLLRIGHPNNVPPVVSAEVVPEWAGKGTLASFHITAFDADSPYPISSPQLPVVMVNYGDESEPEAYQMQPAPGLLTFYAEVTHTYKTVGRNRATITVQDADGAQGNSIVFVTIDERSEENIDLYFKTNETGDILVEDMPTGSIFTPRYFPNSNQDIDTWSYIGNWSIYGGELPQSVNTTGFGAFLKIANEGSTTAHAFIRCQMKSKNGDNLSERTVKEVDIKYGGTPEIVRIWMSVLGEQGLPTNDPRIIGYDDGMVLVVEAHANRSGLKMVYDSKTHYSMVRMYGLSMGWEEPMVDNVTFSTGDVTELMESEDDYVNIGVNRTFQLRAATSPDDRTYRYTWDMGDGTSLSGNPVTHRYTSGSEETREITLWVRDMETGMKAEGFYRIMVVMDAFPEVLVNSPSNLTVVDSLDTLRIEGTSYDDYKVTRVEIKVGDGGVWTMASGTEEWYYDWTIPSYQENGDVNIYIRAQDDVGKYSPVSVLMITVDIPSEDLEFDVSIIPSSALPGSDITISVSVYIPPRGEEVDYVEVDLDDLDGPDDLMLEGQGDYFEAVYSIPETIEAGNYEYVVTIFGLDGGIYEKFLEIEILDPGESPSENAPTVEEVEFESEMSLGERYTLTAVVQDDDGPDDIANVTVTCSPIGIIGRTMRKSGDQTGLDSNQVRFMLNITIRDTSEEGNFTINFTVKDRSGMAGYFEDEVNVVTETEDDADDDDGFSLTIPQILAIMLVVFFIIAVVGMAWSRQADNYATVGGQPRGSSRKMGGLILTIIAFMIIILGAVFAYPAYSADYTDEDLGELLTSGEIFERYEEGDRFTSTGVVDDKEFVNDLNNLIESGAIDGDKIEAGDGLKITWEMQSIFDLVRDIEDSDVSGPLGPLTESVVSLDDMMESMNITEEEMEQMAEDMGMSLIFPFPVKIEKMVDSYIWGGMLILGGVLLLTGIVLMVRSGVNVPAEQPKTPLKESARLEVEPLDDGGAKKKPISADALEVEPL